MQSLGEDGAEAPVQQAVTPTTEMCLRWSKVRTLQGAQQPLSATWVVKVLPLLPPSSDSASRKDSRWVWTKWTAISRHLLSRQLTTTASMRFLPPWCAPWWREGCVWGLPRTFHCTASPPASGWNGRCWQGKEQQQLLHLAEALYCLEGGRGRQTKAEKSAVWIAFFAQQSPSSSWEPATSYSPLSISL